MKEYVLSEVALVSMLAIVTNGDKPRKIAYVLIAFYRSLPSGVIAVQLLCV